MTLQKVKVQAELLNKILTAFKEAKDEGIKDPMVVLKKALEKRVWVKVGKSRQKKHS